MFHRRLSLSELLKKKSFFLFGPRSTGKTTLIENSNIKKTVFDLLHRDTYKRLLDDPAILASADPATVTVIDEIQKIPFLLDEVHRLIQKDGRRFLLTGSSARKLKRGAANLLAGRAWQAELFPLTYSEIPDFDLLQYLNRGGLPHIYDSEDPREELAEYVSLYLREEVAAEALTRNLESFSQFLDLAAQSNGGEVSYQGFAADCGVSLNTAKNYFDILEETLIGFRLPAFTQTKKRKAISRAKHYLFDCGVANYLRGEQSISKKSAAFGNSFEHFLIGEVRAHNSYKRLREKLTYWRSTSQFEVDLIIGRKTALEIKSTDKANERHTRSLKALQEEGLIENFLVISQDPVHRELAPGIFNLHWESFLKDLDTWVTSTDSPPDRLSSLDR